jgi:hypothetical protein
MYVARAFPLIAAALLVTSGTSQAQDKTVTLMKTPDGGIQPQVVVDGKGVVHLVYFKGDAKAGDLMYARREAGQHKFSAPLRVNSQPGSAIAVGTIRGGQLAVGKNGRVHVAWNGSGKAQPRGPGKGAPMLYARLNDKGTAFEEQRNLMTATDVLDGGGTVAADQAGNVYVAWHAVKIGSSSGEDQRKVFVAISADEGRTFAAEAPVYGRPTGACGCCGMKALADSKGNLFFLYRSAKDGIHRDVYLLSSTNGAKSAKGVKLHGWEISACPMSSLVLLERPAGGVFAAWDTDGQVYFTWTDADASKLPPAQAAPGAGKGRKHPALAVHTDGRMILAWTEGTGWQKGGALAWQVYDASGKATAEHGRLAGGIAVWGLAAVIAEPGGRFTILH